MLLTIEPCSRNVPWLVRSVWVRLQSKETRNKERNNNKKAKNLVRIPRIVPVRSWGRDLPGKIRVCVFVAERMRGPSIIGWYPTLTRRRLPYPSQVSKIDPNTLLEVVVAVVVLVTIPLPILEMPSNAAYCCLSRPLVGLLAQCERLRYHPPARAVGVSLLRVWPDPICYRM